LVGYTARVENIHPQTDGNANKGGFFGNRARFTFVNIGKQQPDCVGADVDTGEEHNLLLLELFLSINSVYQR
jgi:hypothetical protein